MLTPWLSIQDNFDRQSDLEHEKRLFQANIALETYRKPLIFQIVLKSPYQVTIGTLAAPSTILKLVKRANFPNFIKASDYHIFGSLTTLVFQRQS